MDGDLRNVRSRSFWGFHHPVPIDLTPTAITTPELIVNQPGTINATIANVGTFNASAFNVSLSADGSVVDTVSVTSLGAGNSTDVSFEWTPASGGDQELCVVADSDKAIAELDEANNEMCILVTVNAPDLTPTAINVPPLLMNQPSTINATIANVGVLDAASFNVSLSADGTVVGTASVTSLGAGNTTDVSFAWTPASGGDIELCVVADHENTIVEMNETNNKTCIEVKIKPDLITTGITIPELNKSSVINATIANIGNADASSFNVSLSADGSVVDTVSVSSLGVGNSTNVSFEWIPTSAGDINLCVVADSGNAIDELVETNNELCVVVTVENIKWQYGAIMPYDVERLSGGNTLITEYGNHTVIEVTPLTKKVIYGTGTSGSGANQLNCPVDAERLSGGSTLIADSKNHRVIEVDSAKNIVWQYGNGAPGDGINQLKYPMDVEWLANGNTLITDEHNCRIIELRASDYDPAKTDNGFTAASIVWQYGTTGVSGSGPNELNYPKDADRLDNGNTLIADYRNHRVIEVTPGKNVFWQYGTGSHDEPGSGPNELNNPTDAERLPNGNTLIADNSNHRVIEITPAKKIIGQYGTSEVAGSGENELNRPADAERLPNGNMLIADTINNRIIEVVELPLPSMIVSCTPSSPVYDTEGATRTFSLTTDQTVDVEWLLDSVIVKTDTGVTESSYTGTAILGTRNVTAITSNANGADTQQWVWISAVGPELTVSMIDAYHNKTLYPKELYPPYFNLENEVDVTVTNIGTEPAVNSSVNLYVDDEFIGKLPVPCLSAGANATVQFKWTPSGIDCEDGGSAQTFTLKAMADCDNDVNESVETNNELNAQETAYWAGYSADEELVEASHGTIRGGLLYTTGDGSYVGLYNHGNSKDTHYEITLPESASVRHARLNVYYTWSRTEAYPVMEVSITNDATDESHTFTSPAASYNDRPCDTPAISYEYPWGNYVYDLTPCIQGSGSYTVRVTNSGTSDNPSSFCPAAPGLVIVYEDSIMPEYEYWILEGADVLEGGRRGGAGYLSLEECTNDAVFLRSIDISNVSSATLGMVSAWGGAAWGEHTSYYWFNDNYLGEGGNTLFGYNTLYDKTVDGMSMFVGASGYAQVGANVSDVTDYIVSNDNVVSFGDDGDSMMPSNAFLLVEYDEPCRGKKPEPASLVPFMISGSVKDVNGTAIDNPNVTIENVNTSKPLPDVETHDNFSHYQVLASLDNVSCGDVLQFIYDGTTLNHTISQREMDVGGFDLDIAVEMMPEPDLNITDKFETLLPDGTFTVNYTVKNIGGGDAGASSTTIYIDGVNVLEDTVPALAAGASYTDTVGSFDCPCGLTLNVTVCADNGNIVDESDEGNNCLTNEFACPPCPEPDLNITDKFETLLPDGTFTVNYTVKNIGGGDAGASNTTIYIDGVSKKEDSVPALAAGASYTNTVGPFECTCNQTLNVTVCADNNDMVDESDEGNNCLSNELVCPVCTEFTEAGVRIEPEVLNLDNKGAGVFTAFITLPADYDVADINVSTVVCEEAPAQSGTVASAGNGTYVVNFRRDDLRDLPTGDVLMTVEGNLFNGTAFEGSDTVEVIGK